MAKAFGYLLPARADTTAPVAELHLPGRAQGGHRGRPGRPRGQGLRRARGHQGGAPVRERHAGEGQALLPVPVPLLRPGERARRTRRITFEAEAEDKAGNVKTITRQVRVVPAAAIAQTPIAVGRPVLTGHADRRLDADDHRTSRSSTRRPAPATCGCATARSSRAPTNADVHADRPTISAIWSARACTRATPMARATRRPTVSTSPRGRAEARRATGRRAAGDGATAPVPSADRRDRRPTGATGRGQGRRVTRATRATRPTSASPATLVGRRQVDRLHDHGDPADHQRGRSRAPLRIAGTKQHEDRQRQGQGEGAPAVGQASSRRHRRSS